MNKTLKEEMETYARLAANCRNGKQVAINFSEWERTREGVIDGARWMADKYAPLVKALKYYASGKHFEEVDSDIVEVDGIEDHIPGKTARKALQEIGEGKDE